MLPFRASTNDSSAGHDKGSGAAIVADRETFLSHTRDEHSHNEVVLSEQASALLELSTACTKADCKKVLILGPRTKMSLSAFDILELGAEIAKLDLQLAIVELHNASDDAVSLLESAALNRGGAVRFFDGVEDAKDWLGIG